MDKEIVVIKCGGSTLDALPDSFYEEIAALRERGVVPVMVHGGGPAISGMLEQMNITPQFVDGMRVTDEVTLQVVQMVLIGRINKQIVVRMQQAAARATGVSGIDGGILQAVPLNESLGYVGRITQVNPGLIHDLIDKNYTVVVSPLACDGGGQVYNINADTAAGAIAAVLGARQLVMVTDVPGVMKPDAEGNKQVLSLLSEQEVESLIADGVIYGGMIPKVKAALDGLNQGVAEVVIVDGKEDGILTQVVERKPVGTRIVKDGVTIS